MKKALLFLMMACCVFGLSVDDSHAQEEEHQDGGTSECIASWDPFCPRGTPTEEGGGGGDYPSDCYFCEMTPTGEKCSQVAEGSTGRTDCSNIWEGTDPVWCETSAAFCENITVTG